MKPVGMDHTLELLLVGHLINRSRDPRKICSLSMVSTTLHASLVETIHEIKATPASVRMKIARPADVQFTWREELRLLEQNSDRTYSRRFRSKDGSQWRLLIFPRGDHGHNDVSPSLTPHVSLYLDVADAAMLGHGWSRDVHFLLTIANRDCRNSITKYCQHEFDHLARDWGFREFAPRALLENVGFVYQSGRSPDEPGKITIQAKVWIERETQRQLPQASSFPASGGSQTSNSINSASSSSSASTVSELAARSFGSSLWSHATWSRAWRRLRGLRMSLSRQTRHHPPVMVESATMPRHLARAEPD